MVFETLKGFFQTSSDDAVAEEYECINCETVFTSTKDKQYAECPECGSPPAPE